MGGQRPRAAGKRDHHREPEAHPGAGSRGAEDHPCGLRLLSQRRLDHRGCDHALGSRASPVSDSQGLPGSVIFRSVNLSQLKEIRDPETDADNMHIVHMAVLFILDRCSRVVFEIVLKKLNYKVTRSYMYNSEKLFVVSLIVTL